MSLNVNDKSIASIPIEEIEKKYIRPILKKALIGKRSESVYLAKIVTVAHIATIIINLF